MAGLPLDTPVITPVSQTLVYYCPRPQCPENIFLTTPLTLDITFIDAGYLWSIHSFSLDL